MDSALSAVSLVTAHLGSHGGHPLSGLVADLVLLAGPALLVGAAWLVVNRIGR